MKAILAGNTITALRTAAAAAVSIDRLAVAAPIALGLVGTGHQSAFQLEAALRVRSFSEVWIWNRSNRDLSKHHQIAEKYGAVCLREAGLEDVVRSSQVIITIASCFESLFPGDWVSSGTHVAAMGTDTKRKARARPVTDILVPKIY